MEEQKAFQADLLVIGAGISGISTALEAAETGFSVVLVEKNPYIGGRVAQLNQYFPKLCPPSCGLEINTRRLRDNPNIKLLTLADAVSTEGSPGSYKVAVKLHPRYVNGNCTSCGECTAVCPETRKNDFNFGMDNTKTIYLPFDNAFPGRYVIDPKTCKFDKCNRCVEICKYQAIDLNQKAQTVNIEAKSIVWAAGWQPYDAAKLETLGFGKYPEVLTNVMMERLASPNGPTAGKILVPGKETPPKKIAFVQCAGSRDENHLEFCSTVCCLASLKQAQYIREQYKDADIHIFYIDIRANGIYEDFFAMAKKDEKLFLHRGKAAKIFKEYGASQITIEAEDTLAGKMKQLKVDMAVLATGMQPSTSGIPFIDNSLLDRNGFIKGSLDYGIVGCGACTAPKDVASSVQESTAAAIKAIHTIKGGN